jgi:hypothetical protein
LGSFRSSPIQSGASKTGSKFLRIGEGLKSKLKKRPKRPKSKLKELRRRSRKRSGMPEEIGETARRNLC